MKSQELSEKSIGQRVLTLKECERYILRINDCYVDFPWEDRRHYCHWISQTYHYVKYATRMLAEAAGNLPIEDEPFHQYLLNEISEEHGHEKLLESDLRFLGESMSAYPESIQTSFFRKTLSHLVRTSNPCGILGYLIPLEGMGSFYTKYFYRRVSNTFGERAASFLKVHSQLDVTHFQDCLDILRFVDTEEKLRSVYLGLEQCSVVYEGIVTNIRKMAKDSLRGSKTGDIKGFREGMIT